MDRGAWWATVQGVTKSQTQQTVHTHTHTHTHTHIQDKVFLYIQKHIQGKYKKENLEHWYSDLKF